MRASRGNSYVSSEGADIISRNPGLRPLQVHPPPRGGGRNWQHLHSPSRGHATTVIGSRIPCHPHTLPPKQHSSRTAIHQQSTIPIHSETCYRFFSLASMTTSWRNSQLQHRSSRASRAKGSSFHARTFTWNQRTPLPSSVLTECRLSR